MDNMNKNINSLNKIEEILICYSSEFIGCCENDIRYILKKKDYTDDVIDCVIKERKNFYNSLKEMIEILDHYVETC